MGVLVVVWINSGIDSLIRCSAIKLISKVNESQEIGLVPFVVVHGCFWGMFCNSGLIQEYPIRFNLDRRTSSHYAFVRRYTFVTRLYVIHQHTALIIERF